jgi:hypothetical protein
MEQQKRLTAADIWAAPDIETRDVFVPQWGGTVTIKTLSKKEISDIQKASQYYDYRTKQQETDQNKAEALTFCTALVDPIILVEDYPKVEAKSAGAVVVIANAITDLLGLTQAAVDEAGKSPAPDADAPLRVLPGARTRHDARRTARADDGA